MSCRVSFHRRNVTAGGSGVDEMSTSLAGLAQPARASVTHNAPWNNLLLTRRSVRKGRVALNKTRVSMTNMNKLFQILPACAACFLTLAMPEAQAQEGYRMGLTIEPNRSWMVATDLEHRDVEGQFNFGYSFIADIMFSETYAIGTGLNVFRTGGTIELWQQYAEDTVSQATRVLNNQYVEVPFTFKMRTKEIGYSTFFGKFGAGLGMNTKRAVKEDRDYFLTDLLPDGNVDEIDILDVPVDSDQTKLLRASMIIGVGFERKLAGSTALMVGLTYNSSLFSTHKAQDILRVNDDNGYPQGLLEEQQLVTETMKGNDSFFALSLGIVF